MGAFINAMREEGTREEILEALAEALRERDALRADNAELREALRRVRKNIPAAAQTALIIINDALVG